MPRASTYLLEGYTYHLTHRCRDGGFYLRFKRDRDLYRKWLREGARRYGVAVYGYCLTSNHTHIVLHVDSVEAVGLMMGLVAGTLAKNFNRRKEHGGSVWEHPYHCTIVESGRHLLNCLSYVDLNMVRAGEVEHPDSWRWCSYDELTGSRKRYRILNIDRLLDSLDLDTPEQLHMLHAEQVARRLQTGSRKREPQWTVPLGVGSQSFAENLKGAYPNRWKLDVSPVDGEESHPAWTIREEPTPYNAV